MNELNNKIQQVLTGYAKYVKNAQGLYSYATEKKLSKKQATQAILTLITEQVRLGRVDELLSSDDVIRLHGLEDYQVYLTKRITQLKSGSNKLGKDE